jgi:hypothetical protein
MICVAVGLVVPAACAGYKSQVSVAGLPLQLAPEEVVLALEHSESAAL